MIYFIESGDGGPIKIGFASSNVQDRLNSLQVGNPATLRVLARGEGPHSLEQAVHSAVRAERIRGEWYNRGPLVESVMAVADSGGDIAEWVQSRQALRPQKGPDYGPWIANAVSSIIAVYGIKKAASDLGVDPSTISNWAKGKCTPYSLSAMNLLLNYTEHFDLMPDFNGEPHPGLEFQIRVIERRYEALSALKQRAVQIRAARAA